MAGFNLITTDNGGLPDFLREMGGYQDEGLGAGIQPRAPKLGITQDKRFTMTKDGPAPLGHLNPYERTEAETFCWESGIKTQADAKGGMYVTNIDTGDYIKIKSVDFGQRASQEFTARVAAQGKAAIEVCIDAPDAPPAAVLHISPTGGGDPWQTLTTPLPGLKGVHDIYLRFTTDAGAQLKFDWWQCR